LKAQWISNKLSKVTIVRSYKYNPGESQIQLMYNFKKDIYSIKMLLKQEVELNELYQQSSLYKVSDLPFPQYCNWIQNCPQFPLCICLSIDHHFGYLACSFSIQMQRLAFKSHWKIKVQLPCTIYSPMNFASCIEIKFYTYIWCILQCKGIFKYNNTLKFNSIKYKNRYSRKICSQKAFHIILRLTFKRWICDLVLNSLSKIWKILLLQMSFLT